MLTARKISRNHPTPTVTQEAAVAAFPPITHVAVTVTDLERSTRWYGELLGAEPPFCTSAAAR